MKVLNDIFIWNLDFLSFASRFLLFIVLILLLLNFVSFTIEAYINVLQFESDFNITELECRLQEFLEEACFFKDLSCNVSLLGWCESDFYPIRCSQVVASFMSFCVNELLKDKLFLLSLGFCLTQCMVSAENIAVESV